MPDAVIRHSDEVYQAPDGRKQLGLTITVTDEIMAQYQQGYRCIACHHAPQPEAFPKHCVEPYCRFPMRERQTEELSRQFAGHEDLWPQREPVDLEQERWRREHGILVPRAT